MIGTILLWWLWIILFQFTTPDLLRMEGKSIFHKGITRQTSVNDEDVTSNQLNEKLDVKKGKTEWDNSKVDVDQESVLVNRMEIKQIIWTIADDLKTTALIHWFIRIYVLAFYCLKSNKKMLKVVFPYSVPSQWRI